MKQNKLFKGIFSHNRIIVYVLLWFCLLLTFSVVAILDSQARAREANVIKEQQIQKDYAVAYTSYKEILTKESQLKDRGVDTTLVKEEIENAKAQLLAKDFDKFNALIASLLEKLADLDAKKQEADAQKAAQTVLSPPPVITEEGTLTGSVKTGKQILADVTLQLKQGSKEIKKTTSDKSGNYNFSVVPATYTLVASKSGYTTIYKTNLGIKQGQSVQYNVILNKYIAPPVVTKKPSNPSPKPTYTYTWPTYSPDPNDPCSLKPTNIEQFLCYINKHRADQGLNALTIDSALTNVSTKFAQYRVDTKTYWDGHIGPNGQTPWDRCREGGTSCDGEVISSGTYAKEVFVGLSSDPPHDAVMLGNHQYIGIGVAIDIWVIDFR